MGAGQTSLFSAPKKDAKDGLFNKQAEEKPKEMFASGSLFQKPAETKPETGSLFTNMPKQSSLFTKPVDSIVLLNQENKAVGL